MNAGHAPAFVFLYHYKLDMQEWRITQWLIKHRKKVLLFALPLVLAIGLVLVWPNQTCNDATADMQALLQDPFLDDLRLVLDTVALESHCDSFSVIFEKKLWVYSNCKRQKAPLKASFNASVDEGIVEAWMKAKGIGAVHYHFPGLSIEFQTSLSSPYVYRMVYSRDKIGNQPTLHWVRCDQLSETNPSRFFIRLADHWYLSAIAR